MKCHAGGAAGTAALPHTELGKGTWSGSSHYVSHGPDLPCASGE